MVRDRPFMLLVDIQDTLISIPGEHALHSDALESGIVQVTGLRADIRPSRGGHTDFTLVKGAMESIGMGSALNKNTYKLIEEQAFNHYAIHCPSNIDRYIHHGITATLSKFKADRRIDVVPLSGSSRLIGEFILRMSGMDSLMEVGYGSFSDWSVDRGNLVSKAKDRAAGFNSWQWPSDRVIVAESDPENIRAAILRNPNDAYIGIGSNHFATRHHVQHFSDLPEYIAREIFPKNY